MHPKSRFRFLPQLKRLPVFSSGALTHVQGRSKDCARRTEKAYSIMSFALPSAVVFKHTLGQFNSTRIHAVAFLD
jgi:hypothetical protein